MMRTLFTMAIVIFAAAQACAQNTGTISSPTPPSAPTVQAPTVAPTMLAPVPAAGASAAPASSAADAISGQLQKLLSGKKGQDQLGQGIAIASLLGCTGKTAGHSETDAFYKEMQAVGKQVEAYCKARQPDQARALVLNTVKANQSNHVLLAAENCYGTQKANFDMLAGPKLANDTENYARWARDPATAEAEMRNEDICK